MSDITGMSDRLVAVRMQSEMLIKLCTRPVYENKKDIFGDIVETADDRKRYISDCIDSIVTLARFSDDEFNSYVLKHGWEF